MPPHSYTCRSSAITSSIVLIIIEIGARKNSRRLFTLYLARRLCTRVSTVEQSATVRIYPNVALVRGCNELRNGAPGSLRDNHLNILWVSLKGPGPQGWQIVARQTTRLPEK